MIVARDIYTNKYRIIKGLLTVLVMNEEEAESIARQIKNLIEHKKASHVGGKS